MLPTEVREESLAEALRGRRPTWIEVDLDALAHNVGEIRTKVGPGVRLLPVAKADAYGHGAVPVARRLEAEGADLLGVAIPEEGLELREQGIRIPILVLGAAEPDQVPLMLSARLTPTVYSLPFLESILSEANRTGRTLGCHVKLDTGMGRLGLLPEQIPEALRLLAASPGALEIEGLFTTLACADDPGDPFTETQVAAFKAATETIRGAGHRPRFLHAANSGGIIDHPSAWLDTVRPGIAIYGIHPSAKSTRMELRPVLSFRTRLVLVKDVPSGAPIGYGGAFRTRRPSRIGTVPAGYADGLARLVAESGHGLVHGRPAPYAGRISMDLAMIDLTDVPEARVGDEVTLIGRQGPSAVTAETFAAWTHTIPYEALCRLGGRVPRVYLGHGSTQRSL